MAKYLHEPVRVYEKRNGRSAQFNIGSSISMREE